MHDLSRPTTSSVGKVYEFKSPPEDFDAIARGDRKHDLQPDHHGFRVGDYMRLREWDPRSETYTGRNVLCKITHVADACMTCAPAPGVILSLDPLR